MLDKMESKTLDRNEVLERLARMKRELARKEKKLERSKRAQNARAHVKQKLREQALMTGNGQSPLFDQQGETPTQTLLQNCSLTLTSQQNTNENCSNSTCSEKESISREVTPKLARLHKLSRPFLARLGQDNSQSLPSNFDVSFQNSKSGSNGQTLHYVLEELKRRDFDGENVKMSYGCAQRGLEIHPETAHPDDDTDQEISFRQCKITISPDLLEDFPIVTSKSKRQSINEENICDNSLYLTPAPNSGRSGRLNVKKILESSGNDFQDVKLRLDFEIENASRKCTSKEKLEISSHSVSIDKNGNDPKGLRSNQQERNDDCVIVGNTFLSNSCHNPVPQSQKETTLSLKKKRKSCESGEFRNRNYKKYKSSCEAVEGSASHRIQMKSRSGFVSELKSEKESLKIGAHFKETDLCRSTSCVIQVDNCSVLAASSSHDSVSPEPSQSLLKPFESVMAKKECSDENKNNVKLKDIPPKLSTEKQAPAITESHSSQNEKQRHRKKSTSKQRSPKTSVTPVETGQGDSNGYLDFTELDVIPFSQFQYSDCLFSSQDILSDPVTGKKGRRSHFGMLVQRRSPRLSSGLKNIVGDDIKSEETNSVSSTVSCTQNTGSSHSSQQLFPPPEHCQRVSRCQRKSKKGIMISSVFQFIIDEAKRAQEVTEFVLPFHIFNKKLKKRLTCSESCDLPQVKLIANGENKKDGELFGFVKCEKEIKSDGGEKIRLSKEKHFSFKPASKKHGEDAKSCMSHSVKVENACVGEMDDCRNMNLLNEIGMFDNARENSELQRETASKPRPDLLSTPKHEPFCFTTPKHPPSHMSTPKQEEDLFTTPKQQIRRHKFDQPESDLLAMSPSLFPSQEVDDKTSLPFLSPVSASKASPMGDADLPEDGNCLVDADENVLTTFTKVIDTEEPIVAYTHDDGDTETERRTLRTVGSFQTDKNEPVLSVLCGVLHTAGSLVDFVVTLSASSLGIWSLEGSSWTNELDWILPGDCTAEKAKLIPSEDKVVVLVSGSSVKIPVLVSVFVYDWLSGESTKFNLPLAISIASPMSDGICCPLTDRQIIVFCRQASGTNGQKLTLNSSFTAAVDDMSLEGVTGHLTSVCPVQDVSQAVVGLAKESLLHIWNHESGMLLQSVDISICCPSANFLESVYSEQGFLLLTVFSTNEDKPVSLLAVNPMTSASSQVLPFSKAVTWEGVRASAVYEDFLVASDKDGSLFLWDTGTGQLLIDLTNLRTSSLAVDPSKEEIFSGQEDGCVHIYQLS